MANDLRVKDQLRYRKAVAITPGDVLIPMTNAIHVGTDCDLQVLFVDDADGAGVGTPVTLKCKAGQVYRYMVVKILAGTDIVALY